MLYKNLINFPYEAHKMTENGNYENLLKLPCKIVKYNVGEITSF